MRKHTKNRQKKTSAGFLVFLKENISIFLIVGGITLTSLSAIHRYFYNKSIQPQIAETAVEQVRIRSVPKSITFENGISAEITQGLYFENQWTVPEKTAAHVSSSARPGEQGNIIVYGHNSKELFRRLPSVVPGSKVTVTNENGENFLYQVVQVAEVSPEKTSFLENSFEEVLTVYTCSGWFDANRFIVQAKPL